MSDLISRKAVIEYLKELCETKDTSAYGLQLMGNYEAMRSKIAERDCVKSIIEEINDIPSAYDVDKVMEQLEKKMFTADLYEHGWDGQTVDNLLCFGDVYEIIGKGGLEE